jgi:hypothetical protein
MSQKLGSLARKLNKGGLDIFCNFLTLKTFKSNKPLKKARPFSSLVILMSVNKYLTQTLIKDGGNINVFLLDPKKDGPEGEGLGESQFRGLEKSL